MDKKKSLTTGEVAKLCDVSIPTIHKWIREERIKCFKMPGSGKLRIPKEEVYQFMKSYGFPIDEELNKKNALFILNAPSYTKKFVQNMQEQQEYNCHIVNNIFGAGMLTTHEKPDIIFLDLSIQGIDSENFCKTIKDSLQNEKIIVVAVSSAFSSSQKNKLKQCGFNDFLELPLKINVIKKKIDSLS